MRTSKRLYQNAQWAVTTYGIESLEWPHDYPIEKSRLGERADYIGDDVSDWIVHVCEKTWVEGDLFCDAFRQALILHKIANPPDVEKSIAYARYCGTLFWRTRPKEKRRRANHDGGGDLIIFRLSELDDSADDDRAEAIKRYGPAPLWLAEAAE